jgi:hypothetical protein
MLFRINQGAVNFASTKNKLWIALLVISGLYTDVFLVEGKWFAYST